MIKKKTKLIIKARYEIIIEIGFFHNNLDNQYNFNLFLEKNNTIMEKL